jgi:hypothetical protein
MMLVEVHGKTLGASTLHSKYTAELAADDRTREQIRADVRARWVRDYPDDRRHYRRCWLGHLARSLWLHRDSKPVNGLYSPTMRTACNNRYIKHHELRSEIAGTP